MKNSRYDISDTEDGVLKRSLITAPLLLQKYDPTTEWGISIPHHYDAYQGSDNPLNHRATFHPRTRGAPGVGSKRKKTTFLFSIQNLLFKIDISECECVFQLLNR
ncbi:hypothetical protein AVEN_140042-1 [Araneus ventricosus]|uniref:Uncharacterized protein n=1 Tax=Araneus ventricosus TaxID=182803 RepID=A0A4Y2S3S0_ARAVE|nr:hypothetical protein AVEN_140042-1 [Araneus ventricosus]